MSNSNDINNQPEIFPFNEIVGSFLTNNLVDEDVNSFSNDPGAFLKSNLDIDTVASLNVVKNNSKEVHLTLPYYGFMDNLQAHFVNDDTLEDVAAGEIIISILVVGSVLTTVALTGSSAAAAVVGVTAGAIGVAAVAGAAVAGVRHGRGKDIHGNKK